MDTLAKELSDAVATGLGAPFRAREIVFASDLPKISNMKIMRRVVRSL
jgi:acyl-coenzyme A synthetase/AMP-(fatty) acid ligase